jgi:predicted RecB family nuclease
MIVTSYLFDAYLNCATKCWLRSRDDSGTGNGYADWVKTQTGSYRSNGIKRLMDGGAQNERVVESSSTENLKNGTWRSAANIVAQAQNLQSRIHSVERVLSEDGDKSDQFVPVRFVANNKLSKNDKLLLAYDTLVLSEAVGQEVDIGKIVHGDDRTALEVKTSALKIEVRKLTEKISILVSKNSPPDLILNRHCPECEFQVQCRQKAVEADDLSLLSGLTDMERSRHRSKGIFTVTQLSYTFRPRKTSKRAKNPAKPHYFALQALAIRENTVYIHGSPRLPESKTEIYFDIEGLPDDGFYYLVGVLVVAEGRETFHSFWADSRTEELTIFTHFAELLSGLTDFRIFHYGDYESTALKRIRTRLPDHLRAVIDTILSHSTNVLSLLYPHIYFPTYSNSLKHIGNFLGYKRQNPSATGLESVIWRKTWETDRSEPTKTALLVYNKDDCFALKHLCDFIGRLNLPAAPTDQTAGTFPQTMRTDELRTDKPRWRMFTHKEFALEIFEHVSKCAYFDYQREKVFLRTDLQLKTINKQHRKLKRTKLRPNQKLVLEARKCLRCRSRKIEHRVRHNCVLLDLRFSESSVKKWITQTISSRYYCFKCARQFSSGEGDRRPYVKYGHGLMSWCVYWNVVGGLNMSRVTKGLADLFGLFLPHAAVYRFKAYVVDRYLSLYNEILKTLLLGPIIHVDETVVNLRGTSGYVWVMASMDKVYYFYRPSREGSFLEGMLAPFHGILISDFFSAYDSLPCEQQKCLVHFVRDIDDDLLRNPIDTELKALAQDFGNLLTQIISDVDRYGLKRRHLQKHKKEVDRFLNTVASAGYSSELANKYKKRLGKSGLKMFTFLAHDGVPWNNNNAEHAIKRFAKHRRDADGRFTQTSLNEYLVLASILATCEFNNVNGLKFLLSKEITLDGLLKMSGRKANSSPTETQLPETLALAQQAGLV